MSSAVSRDVGLESGYDSGPAFVPSTSRFDVDRIMQSIRNMASISEALRIVGAAVLLASMSVFLLQGWSEGDDIRRYLMLLAQTGMLTAAGFALSHGLKETKGARLFFGLALVSIPANFTILSALVYSVFQLDGALTDVPHYAEWVMDSSVTTGMTVAGAMLVLLPVAMFCFAIMARQSAKTLSLHFFALNLLLLVPVRASLAAGAVALLGIVYALYVTRKLIGSNRALKTAEGKFALITLFIPAGIILFRTMYFYQVDSLLVAMIALAVFLAARQVSMFPDRSPRVALCFEALSLPVALTFALAITNALQPVLATALYAPLFSLAYTLMGVDLLRRTRSRVLARVTRLSVSVFVALSLCMGVLAGPSALAAFICLLAGCAMFVLGLSLRDRTAAIAGAIAVAVSLMSGFESMLALVVSSSWIDLAIFGACAIAMGSVLDRHGVAMKLYIARRFSMNTRRTQEIALDD